MKESNFYYGFRLLGRDYYWKDNKPYRMPSNNKLSCYQKGAFRLMTKEGQKGYNIDSCFYPLQLLERITVPLHK